MAGPHIGFERRVLGALESAPSRIPVLLGGCGTGRTTLLQGVVHLAIFAAFLFFAVVP
jgi:Ca2+:H+ antiporter